MVSNRWDGTVEAVFAREDDAVEHPSASSGAGPRPAVSIRRHVVVSGRDRSASEAVLGEASGLSGSISFVHGDVGLASDCERVVSETVTRYGGLDVLCATAGVYPSAPYQRHDRGGHRRARASGAPRRGAT